MCNLAEKLDSRSRGFDSRKDYDFLLERLHIDDELTRRRDVTENGGLMACRFAKVEGYQHILAHAGEDGYVFLRDTNSIDKFHQIMNAHDNSIFSMAWSDVAMQLVTTSSDLSAKLWVVTDSGCLENVGVFTHGHIRSIKSVDFQPGNPAVFATGARDGIIAVWDTRNTTRRQAMYKPDKQIFTENARDTHRRGKKCCSVTSLKFQDDRYLISCTDREKFVKVWDMRMSYAGNRKYNEAHNISHEGFSAGCTDLILNKNRTLAYVSTISGSIHCFNLSTCNNTPVKTFVGHEGTSFYTKCCLSSDDMYLACVSGGEVSIWKTTCSGGVMGKLKIDGENAADIDWSADRTNIKVAVVTDETEPSLYTTVNCESSEKKNNFQLLNKNVYKHRRIVFKIPEKHSGNSNSFIEGISWIPTSNLPCFATDGAYACNRLTRLTIKNLRNEKPVNWLSRLSQHHTPNNASNNSDSPSPNTSRKTYRKRKASSPPSCKKPLDKYFKCPND